jgi:hypothetical protein
MVPDVAELGKCATAVVVSASEEGVHLVCFIVHSEFHGIEFIRHSHGLSLGIDIQSELLSLIVAIVISIILLLFVSYRNCCIVLTV